MVTDWDVNYNINFTPRFIYYTPLCYQLCTNTENSIDSKFSNKYVAFASNMVRFFNYNIVYRILGLDKNPEPGFSILYFFSKLIFYLVVLALLYTPFILYYIYNNFDVIKDYALSVIREIRSRT